MAFCKKCGQQIPDNSYACPVCGTVQTAAPAQDDTGSIGWAFLGFCIPLAGLIMFLMWKDSKPLSAKKAGIGALIGVGVNVLSSILISVIGIGAGMM